MPPIKSRSDGGFALKKRKKYTRDLPSAIYTYFRDFSGGGAPSLSKFARAAGLTLAELRDFRERHAEFERACLECSEIRRDYLIDAALVKRQDGSFTKFILTSEYGMGDTGTTDGRLDVTVEVLD